MATAADAGRAADRDPADVARDVCLRLLTIAPRTRQQLADALRRRGIEGAVVTQVLDRLTDVGLIDDRAFATAWVSDRHRARGLGRRALTAELTARGVDRATVGEAVASIDDAAEWGSARALVQRRIRAMADLPPQVRVRRLMGLLARRGFSTAVARSVVREVCGDNAGDADQAVGVIDAFDDTP